MDGWLVKQNLRVMKTWNHLDYVLKREEFFFNETNSILGALGFVLKLSKL